MDQLSGGNAANNTRMDLLHGSGDNQQLVNGPTEPVAGLYATAATPQPSSAPLASPLASAAPKAALPTDGVDEQVVAAQSKAVPPPPAPEPRPVTPPGTPNPNHHGPVIAGVLIAILLLVGVGVGGWWFFTQRQASSNPTPVATVEVQPATPSDLSQQNSSGTTVDIGKATSATNLNLQFSVQTSANQGALTPEVELEPLGTAFTGTPNATGTAVNADGHDMSFKVTSSTLVEGKYHWQARVSKDGQSSGWKIYGDDPATVAFIVDATAPAVPTVTAVSGKKVTNPLVLDTNRPEFSGTGEPNAKIAITIAPENTSLTAVADTTGAWKVAATADVANGQHDITLIATDDAGNASQAAKLALSLNPATVADTTPRAAAAPITPAATPAPSAAATVPAKLAATGDSVALPTLISLGVLMLAIGGLLLTRRRYALG